MPNASSSWYSAPRRALAFATIVAALSACTSPGRPAAGPGPAAAPRSADALPPVPREFRAVWVATVANIDWPSRPGLPADSQRAELVAIMDRSAALNLNAVILQVRPAGDALYASPHEPWSEYLTGQSGRDPGYDPLAFAVDEAHRRGMELHAWFNPYRARHPSARSENTESHITRRRPELVRRYGGNLWMDPGEPEVRAHSQRVMLDVVSRYDIDGVHVDDYFYPYPETDAAGPIGFPDEPSWRKYVRGGGRLARDDWRRQNVNTLIQEVYRGIKDRKPWVKFGISPFGVYRPGQPAGQGTRFDQYAQLYADARLWLREGWMDYFTPQLYWPISRPDLSYPVLLRWWVEQNVQNRHMWPGNFASRVEVPPAGWRAEEITDQVWVTRGMPGATGNVHFSMKVFLQNRDSINERLVAGPYRHRALVPASPWLGGAVLAAPSVTVQLTSPERLLSVRMQPAPGTDPRWWVVRWRRGSAWGVDVVPGGDRTFTIPEPAAAVAPAAPAPPPAPPSVVDLVTVSPVDRLGVEGEAARAVPPAVTP